MKERECRIFYRCVDWNPIQTKMKAYLSVASFTDAWIETSFARCELDWLRVASFTDAWIETYLQIRNQLRTKSHLLQMRGLKPRRPHTNHIPLGRIFYRCVDWNKKALKKSKASEGRIFYRCVDWNNKDKEYTFPALGRIFYRCVDWNLPSCALMLIEIRRIFYRCVDWNLKIYRLIANMVVASFTDAWIETQRRKFNRRELSVASFTDAWIETVSIIARVAKALSHLLQMRGLKLL